MKLDNKEKIALLINTGLVNKKISVKELAKSAKVDKSNLYNILKMKKGLSRQVAVRIAESLDISQVEILEAAGYQCTIRHQKISPGWGNYLAHELGQAGISEKEINFILSEKKRVKHLANIIHSICQDQPL
jgi:hypothetical protein